MTRPKWIETAHQIPPADEFCVVWHDGDYEFAAFDPYNARPWWIVSSGQGSFETRLDLQEITHWLPVPDPLWEDQQP